MVSLDAIKDKINLDDLLEKFNLSADQKKAVLDQAADAVNYRAKKESGRGNGESVQKLLSSDENDEKANVISKKLEGDFEYNMKKKTDVDESIIGKIKSTVMERFLGGASSAAEGKGKNDGKGLMELFAKSDMLENVTDKIKGFF